jgi:2-dehydro-3-deoxyphosphogluconate aldolase/(4S)-4-hydroxy-2-oxoglutarate aldolase
MTSTPGAPPAPDHLSAARDFVLDAVGITRVVPVVVVDGPDDAVAVTRALVAGGLPVAEITFRTAGARDAVAAVADQLPDVLVGAGTVLNVRQVDDAVAAGARFLVSPGLSRAVVERAHEHGVPIVPGVATPTEIIAALDLGLDVVKLFPAGVIGGVAAVKALAAPFPDLRFVPTGGISAASASEYLAQRSVLAVGGSWMVDRALVAAGDWAEVTRRTAEAVTLAHTTGGAR